MKITRPDQRQQPETIVALIDVVFFLLVFFMLVGRMDATSPFEVTPPLSQSGTDMPGGGATIAVSAEGGVALDGVPLPREDLLRRLRDRLSDKPDLFVRINAHHRTQLRNVLPLVAEIEALGASDVALVVTPEQAGR